MKLDNPALFEKRISAISITIFLIAFFSLVPLGIPLIFLGLHLGVAVIQAYVFFLLAAIYLSLAVAHDH